MHLGLLEGRLKALKGLFQTSEEPAAKFNFLELLSTAPIAVYLKNAEDDFRYTIWNSKCAELFQLPVEDVVGKTDSEIWGPLAAESQKRYDLLALERNEPVLIPDHEVEINGRRLWIRACIIALKDVSGRPKSLVGIVQDSAEVTEIEQKQNDNFLLEGLLANVPGVIGDGVITDVTGSVKVEMPMHEEDAQLLATGRFVILGQMAGAVVHEMNTPLASIMMCGDRIKEVLASPHVTAESMSEMGELNEIILRTASDIAKIVSGLRKFVQDSRNDEIVETDLVSIVREALHFCSERTKFGGITVDFHEPEKRILAACHSLEIGQVVTNLYNNSVDAVAGTKNPWIRIEFAEVDEFAEVRIIDSGVGFEPAAHAKIFDPYFTTKRSGKSIGLGLSISRESVERQGGKFFFDAAAANTTFVVRLPKRATFAR